MNSINNKQINTRKEKKKMQKLGFWEVKWTTMRLPRKLEEHKLMKSLWRRKILREIKMLILGKLPAFFSMKNCCSKERRP